MQLNSEEAGTRGASTLWQRTARIGGTATLIFGTVAALGVLAPASPVAASSHASAPPVCGHQPGLNDPTNTHNKVMSSYYFTVTDGATTTNVCTLFKNVKAGDTVTAHFVMTAAGDATEVTLAAYNAPPPNPHSQTLFACSSFGDTASDNCNSSSTTDLTVNVPQCGFQVDLIYGEAITPLTQGTYLKNHVFVSGDEGKNPACTPASITTTPLPASGALGISIKDSATVTPSTTVGTVNFNLYGPTDPTCVGSPVFSSSGALSSGVATSGSFTPTVAGTYHWSAAITSPSLSSVCSEPVTLAASGGGGTTPTPTPTPGGVSPVTTTVPSTGAGLPLPLALGLILSGAGALAGERRFRRRLY